MTESRAGHPSSVAGVASSTVVAMHGEEAARAAAFGRVVTGLTCAGLVLQAWYGGDSRTGIAMSVALALLGSVAAWVWIRARDPSRYSRAVFRIFGVASAFASIVFIHHLGVFSPLPAAMVLGLSFFGSSDDSKVIVGVSLFVTAAYFSSAVLITLDVIPDLGVFVPATTAKAPRYAMTCMVTLILLAQLWQSRLTRRATLDAIARAHEAARVASAREAQLAEARDNLDAAIRAGAGRAGRWTGTRLGGYTLEDVVGRGAMGEVYAARVDGATTTDVRVAVKLMHVARSDDPELVRRFVREAEIAMKVRGPNLVDVRDVGEAPDGSAYIAMELLEGDDLASLLRGSATLPLEHCVLLVNDVARGLEVLHAANVVHRDLKPQNLFRCRGARPSWKILDYGVSKLVDGTATLTEGNLVGTPAYMSPEQAQGRAVDARSDVFALACVAYRVLTGRRPFAGADTPEVLYHVVYDAPIRPRELSSAIPRDVELVLAIALAKKAEERFRSAASFAVAFEAASRGQLDAALRDKGEKLLSVLPWARDPVNAMSRTAIAVPPTARGRSLEPTS